MIPDSRKQWLPAQTPIAASVHSVAVDAVMPWEQELGPDSLDHDTWLLSFADILMLLLTLFVLLLAYKDGPEVTQPDHGANVSEPVEAMVAKLTTVEPQLAVAEQIPLRVAPMQAAPAEVTAPAHSSKTMAKSSSAPVIESVTVMTAAPSLREAAPNSMPLVKIAGMPGMYGLPDRLESSPPPAPQLSRVEQRAATDNTAEKLLADLQDSALKGRVEVTVLPNRVNVEISDSILFTPASAALTPSGKQLLDELASALAAHPYKLSVEGHTDNVPIQTLRYPSNWELSSSRATEVTRRLIDRGIAAQRVRAVGYADTHPRADNATAEGKTRNRRVSLVLMETR